MPIVRRSLIAAVLVMAGAAEPAPGPTPDAELFGTGSSGSGIEYPDCGPSEFFDVTTATCAATAAPIPVGTTALRLDATCAAIGEIDAAFTAPSQMAAAVECVLPAAVDWLSSEYGGTTPPAAWGATSTSMLPNNFVYVPTGVVGNQGCDFSDQSLTYCPWDGNIYVGEQQMWTQYSRFGSVDVWGSIGHELGHRVQHLAGRHEASTNNEMIPSENQADCFSGAFLGYAARFGHIDLAQPGGGLMDVFFGLFSIGEREGPDRAHGTSDQRVRAFFVGYNSFESSGVADCSFYVTDVAINPS